MDASPLQTTDALCRHCRRKTRHEIVRQEIDTAYDYDDEGFVCGTVEQEYWQIIRCCGCRKFAFRTYCCVPGDDWDDDIWGEQVLPPVELEAKSAREFHRLPPDVARAYQEVVKAFNAGLFMLGAMGVRMVIEGICTTSGISGKLHEQIDTLRQQGLLTVHQAQILHELRKHGNEAAHELFMPSAGQMKAYLQVLETTLEVLYEYDALTQIFEAERLKRRANKASP